MSRRLTASRVAARIATPATVVMFVAACSGSGSVDETAGAQPAFCGLQGSAGQVFENADQPIYESDINDYYVLADFLDSVERDSLNPEVVALVAGAGVDVRTVADSFTAAVDDDSLFFELLASPEFNDGLTRIDGIRTDFPAVNRAVEAECAGQDASGLAVAAEGAGSEDQATQVRVGDGTAETGGVLGQPAVTTEFDLGNPDVLAVGTVAPDGPVTISTDISSPTQYTADFTVDRVVTTSIHDGTVADPRSKLALVDYRLSAGADLPIVALAEPFRVVIGDRIYNPTERLIDTMLPGQIINDSFIVVIPADTTSFQIQAGDADGQLATIDVELTADPLATAHLAEQAALTGAVVEAVGTVDLSAGDRTMALETVNDNDAVAGIVVTGAAATHTHAGETAEPFTKFVVVDIDVILTDGVAGNVSERAFRLEHDGELYTPVAALDEFLQTGQGVGAQLVFEVPSTARNFELEAGAIGPTVGAPTSTFSIALR